MSKPTIVCRIAFASNPFVASPSWNDVTNDLVAFGIRRGRQNELDRMEAGTAIVVLNNISGNYWPGNTGGTYYPNVLPLKRINIRATYGATTYDLYTGYIESYEPIFRSNVSTKTQMVLSCVDIIKCLSRLLLNDATGYSQELSGTRVDNVLTDLGWLGTTDTDTGQGTMIATGAIANINALDHLFNVQDSEAGIIYVAGDGDIQFEDRHHRVKGVHTVSQATFGAGAGDMKYHGLSVSYDDQLIYNDIRIKREGGIEQTSSDATSQTTYGVRSLAKTGLLMTNDNDALAYADYLKTRYKTPFFRVKSITIKPEADEANLYPKALGYDISTRVTLQIDQPMVDEDYFIESVAHRYSLDEPWQTTWELSKASSYQYWQLGTAGFSELGQTTYLHF